MLKPFWVSIDAPGRRVVVAARVEEIYNVAGTCSFASRARKINLIRT